MSPELFRKQYRILSARATWHDYSGGAYFITICTHNKQHFFGEIINGEMHFSEIGEYADEQLRNVQTHYPYAQIPLWVVMPNHLHAIVIIDGDNYWAEAQCRDVARNVSDNNKYSSTGDIEHNVSDNNDYSNTGDVARNVSTMNATNSAKNEIMAQQSPKFGSLAVVIRGIKSSITKFANQHAIPFAWQTRFHDHVVRDRNEMNQIAEYIEYNVARWESDAKR